MSVLMTAINAIIFKSNSSGILTPNDKLKTQIIPPGEPPELKKKFGSYCIRAQSKLIDKETSMVDTIFKGYDTTVDIMERVDTICKQKAKHKEMTCLDPEICFIGGDTKQCDGHIMVVQGDKSWIIPPRFF